MDTQYTCLTYASNRKPASVTFGYSLQQMILVTIMMCAYIFDLAQAGNCGSIRRLPDNGRIILVYTPMQTTPSTATRYWFKHSNGQRTKVFDANSNANPKGYTERFKDGEHMLEIAPETPDINGDYTVNCGANSQTQSITIGSNTLESENCGKLQIVQNDISIGDKFQLWFIQASGTTIQWQKQEGNDFRELTFGNRQFERTEGKGQFALKVYISMLSDTGTYRVLCNNGLTSNTVELRIVLVPPSTPVFDGQEHFTDCTNCLKAVSGRMLRVACTSYNGTRPVSLTMYKNMQKVTTSYHYGVDNIKAMHDFTPTLADENTEFKCSAKNDAILLAVEASVRLYMLRAPSTPVIGSTEGFEGSPISVRCVTEGARPAPGIQFLFNNTFRIFTVNTVRTQSDDTFTAESVFTEQLTRIDNGKDINCCAVHDAVSGKLECSNKTLNIAFPPKSVSLRSRGQVSDELGNTKLNLTCEVEESNPKSTVDWKGLKNIRRQPIARNNDKGPFGWRYTHELAIELSKEDNGRTITCAGMNVKFPDLQLTANFVVNITYSPVISILPGTSLKVYEGDDVTVTCKVDSNPDSAVHWHSESGMVNEDAVNTGPNTAVLRLINVTLDSLTMYACAAHNGIGEGKVGNVSLVVLDRSKKPLPLASGDNGANTGAVVAGVIVMLIAIAIVIVVVVVVRRKRSNKAEKTGSMNGSVRLAVEERKPSVQPPGPVYSNVAMAREEVVDEPAEYACVVPKDQRPKKGTTNPSGDSEVHDKRPEATQELVYADLDLERPGDTNLNNTRKASTHSATEYVTINFNKTGPEYTDSG